MVEDTNKSPIKHIIIRIVISDILSIIIDGSDLENDFLFALLSIKERIGSPVLAGLKFEINIEAIIICQASKKGMDMFILLSRICQRTVRNMESKNHIKTPRRTKNGFAWERILIISNGPEKYIKAPKSVNDMKNKKILFLIKSPEYSRRHIHI